MASSLDDSKHLLICYSVLLFNEIKYVSSSVELHDIENEMKGRGDVIITFVRAIGVPGTVKIILYWILVNWVLRTLQHSCKAIVNIDHDSSL